MINLRNSIIEIFQENPKSWFSKKELYIELLQRKKLSSTKYNNFLNDDSKTPLQTISRELQQITKGYKISTSDILISEKSNNVVYFKINNGINISLKKEYLLSEKIYRKEKIHFYTSRDNKFIKDIKELFFKTTNGLCQGSKCPLKNKYSKNYNLEKDYIEAHHIKEVSKSFNNEKKQEIIINFYENEDDVFKSFLFLCPSCHKAIHLKNKK